MSMTKQAGLVGLGKVFQKPHPTFLFVISLVKEQKECLIVYKLQNIKPINLVNKNKQWSDFKKLS